MVEMPMAPPKQIIVSLTASRVDVARVRDLHGLIEREKAQIGVRISLPGGIVCPYRERPGHHHNMRT
jgi:hypothetical protein